jgi:hypothetical protein
MICDTFLTMLALPVLYLLFGKGPKIEGSPGQDRHSIPKMGVKNSEGLRTSGAT